MNWKQFWDGAMAQKVLFYVSAFVLGLFVGSACPGCASPLIQSLEVSESVIDVLTRHDNYVYEDISLHQIKRDSFLGQSRGFREYVALTPEIDVQMFHHMGDPIFNRHNNYVASDTILSELDRRIYLRSGELLLKVGK